MSDQINNMSRYMMQGLEMEGNLPPTSIPVHTPGMRTPESATPAPQGAVHFIDYRALLVKYMANVLNEEGVSFVNVRGYGFHEDLYTPDELAELERIEEEARQVSLP